MGEPLFVRVRQLGLAPSYGVARRLVRAGKVYIGEIPCADEDHPVSDDAKITVRT